MTGTLYGVGVGPGDPDLITLKALNILKRVPVIAWPAPLEGDSLARSIAAPHLTGLTPVEIPIRMPLTAPFPAEPVYQQAAGELAAHLDAGRDVAVLCEGDPFFYGSFIYLFARMAEKFPVQVVPGVSSLTACPAALAMPLAARNDILTILPAPLETDRLRHAIEQCDACAIIKPGRHLNRLRDLLRTMGLLQNAGYIEHATMDRQRIMPLEEVDADNAPYFSMILLHRRGRAWMTPASGSDSKTP